jgi:hypothetical protein
MDTELLLYSSLII